MNRADEKIKIIEGNLYYHNEQIKPKSLDKKSGRIVFKYHNSTIKGVVEKISYEEMRERKRLEKKENEKISTEKWIKEYITLMKEGKEPQAFALWVANLPSEYVYPKRETPEWIKSILNKSREI